jgi:hypothetical protein
MKLQATGQDSGFPDFSGEDHVLLDVSRGEEDGVMGIEPWLRDGAPAGETAADTVFLDVTPERGEGTMGIEPWLRDGAATPGSAEGEDDGAMGIEPWLRNGGDMSRVSGEDEVTFGIEPWLMDGRMVDAGDFLRIGFTVDSL